MILLNIGPSPMDFTLTQLTDMNSDKEDVRESASPIRISILIPSRKRSQILERMLKSIVLTTEYPEALEVLVCIDDDDEETLAMDMEKWPMVKRIVSPRQSMGKLNAICYARSTGDIIILGNDDIVVRTHGWDERIREEARRFPDQVYLLYPNDLMKGNRLSTFPVVSRTMCDTIISPFPAEYRGAFIDVHLLDIFRQLEGMGHKRIVYLDGVIFEHMHYRLGKSGFDATYRERNRFGDDRTFMALLEARLWAARRLDALIAGHKVEATSRLQEKRPAGGWFFHLAWDVLRGGVSPWPWRLRLFVWLCLRFAYKNLKRL